MRVYRRPTDSPSLRRWLQRDPLGYVDGVNLYGYVGGNPLSWVDPLGLVIETPWDIANVVYDAGRTIKNLAESAYEAGRYGYHHVKGNAAGKADAGRELREDLGELGESAVDLLADGASAITPGVPAGVTKGVRAGAKAAKAVGKKALQTARERGIRGFWKAERDRLARGEKGTRDWTEDQKRDILAGRRPKDADGNPIEGHHVEPVKEKPSRADDPTNIVPLTYEEHRGKGTGIHSKP